jgi:hypothetical protein
VLDRGLSRVESEDRKIRSHVDRATNTSEGATRSEVTDIKLPRKSSKHML